MPRLSDTVLSSSNLRWIVHQFLLKQEQKTKRPKRTRR
jgi:hypothetical protein